MKRFPTTTTPLESADCRPAHPSEVEPALRVLLSTNGDQPAGDQQVMEFLAFAQDRGIDVDRTWVASRDGRVRWALLPVVSPGRTMLLFTPTRLGSQTDLAADVRPLADALCTEHARRGIHLAQLLIDPADRSIIDAYEHCGFTKLAELLYLQRALKRVPEAPPVPAGLTIHPYSQDSHAAFADAITRSYESSRDCPGLNGMRDVQDVITGHRHTGDFDAKLWFVLRDGPTPIGVLLLSRVQHGAPAVELVYLGLSGAARGRGLGDWLMRLALARAAQSVGGRGHLTLAVDAQNAPALKLYYRHGMQRVGTRVALLRDLRASSISSPTASLPTPHSAEGTSA